MEVITSRILYIIFSYSVQSIECCLLWCAVSTTTAVLPLVTGVTKRHSLCPCHIPVTCLNALVKAGGPSVSWDSLTNVHTTKILFAFIPLHVCPSFPYQPRSHHARKSSHDTPRSARSDGGRMNQPHLRDTIAQEMDGEMLVCDLREFRQHYLPFNPTVEAVGLALEFLQKQELLKRNGDSDDNYTWNKLDSPSKSTQVESEAFKPLVAIFSALETFTFSSTPPRTCNYRFKQHGNISMASRIPGSSHRIDGSFSGEPSPSICDVAVSAELKKNSGSKWEYDVSV